MGRTKYKYVDSIRWKGFEQGLFI